MGKPPARLHGVGTCPACARAGFALSTDGRLPRHKPPADAGEVPVDDLGFCQASRSRIVRTLPYNPKAPGARP